MNITLDFKPIQENLAKFKNILILATANPSLDNVAASLALYLTFKKQEKNVGVACPTPMTVAFNRLIGVDKISDKIGSRNLIISFDYVKDAIEKVSYNIENDKFNLVVEPKPNHPPLNPDKVSYSYTGANADIIFIVGAIKLEDLGKFYSEEKKIFTDKLTVNIDNKHNNTRFGKVNLHNPQLTSCSEIVIALIKSLNLPVDQDIATNLYTGIKANTSNLQAANVNASTLEAAAWCLKNGARKDQIVAPVQPGPIVQTQPKPTPRPISPPPPPFTQQATPPENKEAKPPPDWFKPKIYKGSRPV